MDRWTKGIEDSSPEGEKLLTVPEIQKVGVVGTGTMGHGIAWVSALFGYETCIFDQLPEALQRGRENILKGLERGIEKGRLKAEDRDAAIARLNDV